MIYFYVVFEKLTKMFHFNKMLNIINYFQNIF